MPLRKAETNFIEYLKPLLTTVGDTSELEAAVQAHARLSLADRDFLAAVQEMSYHLTALEHFREFHANNDYFLLEPDIPKVEDVGLALSGSAFGNPSVLRVAGHH